MSDSGWGTREVEPIEYRMMPITTIYDENIVADDEWMGVFETDSGFELKSVELQLPWQSDPLEDWERPAGRRIRLPEETETPLFLVSSSEPVFTPGPLVTLIHTQFLRLPRSTSITLFAPGLAEARLYTTEEGLFLSCSEIQQHITDTYPGRNRSGEFVGVVWAGDLDGDGKVDLLIDDVDDSYHVYDWNLYLSTEASPDQLVGWVASFYDVYY